MEYSGVGGKLIHEKNQTQKINVFRSLKILALENYDCLLRHTFTDS